MNCDQEYSGHCPFCDDDDLDLPGLAYHLDVDCEGIREARNRFNSYLPPMSGLAS